MLLGLGGIWVEALGDVKFLPVGADERQIVEALHNLRTSKVLAGFRGAPPAEIAAVAQWSWPLVETRPYEVLTSQWLDQIERKMQAMFAHTRLPSAGVSSWE